MKKIFAMFMTVVLVVLSITFGHTDSNAVSAATTFTANFQVEYAQTDARSMLEMVNNFRTGGEAWAWNESSTEKIFYDNLSPLTYDYELEKVAMQRAAELVVSYSHTRPDGSGCFTANQLSYRTAGENIAIGTWLGCERAFELWREDDYLYDGQGHRRNMLNSNFTAIGIAHVKFDGCDYWVQEFQAPVVNAAITPAQDGETDVSAVVDSSNVTDGKIEALWTNQRGKQSIVNNSCEYTLHPGDSMELPKAMYTFRTGDTWFYAPDAYTFMDGSWSEVDAGNQTISLEDGKIVAGELPEGSDSDSATFRMTVNGMDIDVTIAAMHTYEKTIIHEPTCTENGVGEYTCSQCGKRYTSEIEKTEHTYITNIVKPTCTEAGYTQHICSGCGASYRDDEEPATGHQWYISEMVMSSSPNQSYIQYTCSVCNASYKEAYNKNLPDTSINENATDDYPKTTTSNSETVNITDTDISNSKKGTSSYRKPKRALIKKVTLSKAGTIKITWKKDTYATGYQLVVATNKKFTKGKKVYVIKKNKTTSKKIKHLKRGKKYFIKVRAYKSVGKKKLYGKYSRKIIAILS